MILRYFTAVAALVSAGLALEVPVTGNEGANNATTPTAQEGNITIHYVTVGKAQNNFQPNSINAKPGDIVTFQFYPSAHSVIKAAYGYPCIPYEDLGLGGHGFYSGVMPVQKILQNPPTWNLTINDTLPTFYYCGAPGSCIDWGMVGVINANASTPISTQISLARQADYQLIPGEPFPNEAQQASLDALAATATTATIVVTATPANTAHTSSAYSQYPSGHHDNTHSSTGLSGGAIAGIAVGAAIVGIAACALFFLLRRTRSLKKKLDAKNEQERLDRERQQQQQMQHQGPYSPMSNSFYDARRTSGLPPYHGLQPKYAAVSQEAKPGDGFGSDRSSTPMSTPYQNQGGFAQQQQQQYGAQEPYRWTGLTSTSELGGGEMPPTELAAEHGHDLNQRDYR